MDIESIVYSAIEKINQDLESEVLKNPTNETLLFSELDSMAVLDLILELEEALQDIKGEYIQIASQDTMDPNKTPFKSVGSTIEYIKGLFDG